jgi:hypothetical protein
VSTGKVGRADGSFDLMIGGLGLVGRLALDSQ